MSENIETLEQLCKYILKYKDTIFVREYINGKWGNYSLGELSTGLALKHALGFIQKGFVPSRLLKEVEN